ncbi:uncharacterized protein DUF1071 [Aneurinibacillus soli]|uniref:SSAP RNA binding domain-containing protein n=1 Tax=Aneurinibacillus soli TaxID=1500254 RepID=A0A0U5AWT8_9BACL|nr:DUF1071 domain-containing protein [Aneurinibacillus soli]PYE64244.1 uncharacterized protein DUF1071 [Aneurinibacillus soli]BAU28193.1 hypothetical protein CB4_02367 [Aneurinibacillus soli]
MGEKPQNFYEKMASVDVGEFIEKKAGFSYLSWSWAVDQLRRHDPTATWEVKRFDSMPYLKTDCGYFVEVAVTCNGVELSQIHPVLDNRNKPIEKPNSFQINTSIQRCLAKAIALHGLGLYIYSGEDLPPSEPQEPTPSIKENWKKLMGDTDKFDAQYQKWVSEGRSNEWIEQFLTDKLADKQGGQ